MIETIKQARRQVLRYLKLRPIHKVMALLKKNGYLMMDNVLEVFGYTGAFHTLDYIHKVKHLEVWEILPECEVELKKNLPKATVKITDSFAEIKATSNRYETIIVDNHQGLFGDEKCEHFDIIEDCFAKLTDKGVIIANFIPDFATSDYVISKETEQKHLSRRRAFYKSDTGIAISETQAKTKYRELAERNGFQLEHIFFVKRNYLVTYVVLCLKRKTS